jgi:hypothetical protein
MQYEFLMSADRVDLKHVPHEAQLPVGKKPQRRDIIAAQKIIADISSGLYRSPAAAIKELVSNAYDADATQVEISTDPPKFRTLTVSDNGDGMSLGKFLDVMEHIGGSRKRQGSDTSAILKRPLIGRIGIGLLAVAQLGTRFYVSSKVRGSKFRFIAEVNLEPFHKDDTALLSMKPGLGDKVQIGAIQYVDGIEEDEDLHYTVISVPDAKKGLTSEITSLVRQAVGATDVFNVKKHPAKKFIDILDEVGKASRADLVLDGYHYMLWELGLLCPVKYLPKTPFNPEIRNVEDIAELRIDQPTKFSVSVDGIVLGRPQTFPNPISVEYPSPDPKLYAVYHDELVADRRLTFHGYIYSQQPRIVPEELRGLHIRIRNVGIGNYDRTWLGYPFNEGIKFGQVSGEIFVEEGLEPALNIDRDSFRETDVHFQALKAHIWNVLRTKVFPEFKSRQKAYTAKRKQQEQLATERQFIAALSELPAPVTEATIYEKVEGGKMIAALKRTKDALHVDSESWEKLIEDLGLDKSAQERLTKVLRVLISSELLIDILDDDFSMILQALALAVK